LHIYSNETFGEDGSEAEENANSQKNGLCKMPVIEYDFFGETEVGGDKYLALTAKDGTENTFILIGLSSEEYANQQTDTTKSNSYKKMIIQGGIINVPTTKGDSRFSGLETLSIPAHVETIGDIPDSVKNVMYFGDEPKTPEENAEFCNKFANVESVGVLASYQTAQFCGKKTYIMIESGSVGMNIVMAMFISLIVLLL